MRATLLALALTFALPSHQQADGEPPLEAKPLPVAALPLPSGLPHPSADASLRELVNYIFKHELGRNRQYQTYDDLDAADLVDIPVNAPESGFYIRTEGRFPIGEMEPNPEKRRKMFRLTREAAGLLYRLADEYRQGFVEEFRDDWEKHYRPFGITGLARPWTYQLKLVKGGNKNADVKAQGIVATHTYALAIDIGRGLMTRTEDRIMRRALENLREQGLCLFFTEGYQQAAYHAIALPAQAPILELAYTQLKHRRDAILEVAQQQ